MEKSIFDTERLTRTYFKLAVPVVLGLVVTLIYNLADTFFIARTNDLDLIAGVSLCSPLFTTFMAFGNIYGQGGSSVLSRALGGGDTDGCARVSSFCFYIAIITGLVIGAIFLVFRAPILTVIGATEATWQHAGDYYTVLAAGAPIVVMNFVHMNLLRCEGMSTQSMCGTAIGAIVNIILDPIFISYLGMGARGAAIATVIGYTVSSLFCLIVVLKKSRTLSVSLKKCRVSKSECGQIFAIGISAAVTNLMSSLCVILTNNMLLPYGSGRIAAMGIVLRINMICQLVLTGFAFGGVPLFGYLFGAGDSQKLKRLIFIVLRFLLILAFSIALILFTFAPMFVGIFVDSGEVISTGVPMLRLQACGSVFVSVVLLMTVLFQATGRVIPAFCCSLSRQGVVYILVLVIASSIAGYWGVISAQCIADALSAIMALALYYSVFIRKKTA